MRAADTLDRLNCALRDAGTDIRMVVQPSWPRPTVKFVAERSHPSDRNVALRVQIWPGTRTLHALWIDHWAPSWGRFVHHGTFAGRGWLDAMVQTTVRLLTDGGTSRCPH